MRHKRPLLHRLPTDPTSPVIPLKNLTAEDRHALLSGYLTRPALLALHALLAHSRTEPRPSACQGNKQPATARTLAGYKHTGLRTMHNPTPRAEHNHPAVPGRTLLEPPRITTRSTPNPRTPPENRLAALHTNPTKRLRTRTPKREPTRRPAKPLLPTRRLKPNRTLNAHHVRHLTAQYGGNRLSPGFHSPLGNHDPDLSGNGMAPAPPYRRRPVPVCAR
jgi:hypothetical protein